MPVYLITLIVALLVSIFIERKYNLQIFHSMKERLQITLLFFAPTLFVDYYGVYHQYWAFLGKGLVGINFFGLPIEEFLFALVAPYFAIVLYKFFHERMSK